MNKIGKIAIVVALIAAIAAAIAVRRNPSSDLPEQAIGTGLPTMIDIGAETCIPCKLMAPILEELKKELQGKVMVQFINLNKYPKIAEVYRITLMPTQIFFDGSGKELSRHEGFYSREDILKKLEEYKLLPVDETFIQKEDHNEVF
jgi:thioredoxin 1